jgi:acyl-lipid omega-6 desaturase (Delta-12 desaturase)
MAHRRRRWRDGRTPLSARLRSTLPYTHYYEAEGRGVVSSIDCIKQQKRAMIERYAEACDRSGAAQVLTTLATLALLWVVAVLGARLSLWLTVAATLLIAALTLRAFALMHDCGHDSLFRSRWLNRTVGFCLGVVAGMPQYVWSQHHNFHHTHNGNWDKYRGPYTTLSIDEYAAMTAGQQRFYRRKCSVGTAPLAGFIYLIFNPRFTWLKGSVSLLAHIATRKLARPDVSIRQHAAAFETRYWKSRTEYWHMTGNNAALLGLWAGMCWACGAALFFPIYIASVSIAGGAGILLFTVQHNFEHAYASGSEGWDYDTGAIDGTSFLILPGWLNWVTADIAYHHVHHLSANIPNYRLVACHNEYRHLFPMVTRVKLSEVYGALKCILWDKRARRIISVAEYQRQP